MTDLTDHPMLAAASDAPPAAIADWLTDQQATLGDVLALVIGDPPFGEGLPHAVLAEWLRAGEPCRVCAPPASAEWAWEAVAGISMTLGSITWPPDFNRHRRIMLRYLLALFGNEPVRVVRRSRWHRERRKAEPACMPSYGGSPVDELVNEAWLELDQGRVNLHPAWPIRYEAPTGGKLTVAQEVPAREFMPDETALRCYIGKGPIGKLRAPHLGLLPRRTQKAEG